MPHAKAQDLASNTVLLLHVAVTSCVHPHGGFPNVHHVLTVGCHEKIVAIANELGSLVQRIVSHVRTDSGLESNPLFPKTEKYGGEKE